ncbi:hypothetical protein INR49_020156 [Caranx melampygus]|nr:hypothetical protein INR49_020156 [Caranx melampygus]
MVVESCRPTLTINLAGARQHWLEGMLRHEIGTHYLRGVNNNLQPWATTRGRKQFGLKPAIPQRKAGQPAQRAATETALPMACSSALLHGVPRHQHELQSALQSHRTLRPGPQRPLGVLSESQEGTDGHLTAW